MGPPHPLADLAATSASVAEAWRLLALANRDLTDAERLFLSARTCELADALERACHDGRITGPLARQRTLGLVRACHRYAAMILEPLGAS